MRTTRDVAPVPGWRGGPRGLDNSATVKQTPRCVVCERPDGSARPRLFFGLVPACPLHPHQCETPRHGVEALGAHWPWLAAKLKRGSLVQNQATFFGMTKCASPSQS